MKELKNEDVKAYIDFEITDLSKKKQIWSNLLFNLMIAVPTAFWGAYSDVTRIVLPLIIIALTVWVTHLSFDIEKKQKSFILFMGCSAFFASSICMLAAYKILSTIMRVDTILVIGVTSLYIISILLNMLNVIRLIGKGHYGKNSRRKTAFLILPFSVLGLGIGKAMIGRIGQNGAVILIASCLMIFALGGAIGTENILKYILMRKIDKGTDCIVIKKT
jgi:hypothetical protein